MAKEVTEGQANLHTLEHLKEKNKIADHIFYGVKVQNGWKAGKQLKEEDFLKAVETFKTGAIKG